MAQVHEADPRLSAPVQRLTGQAGDGLRLHRRPRPGGQDHIPGSFPVCLLELPQTCPHLRVQRDQAVRQFQAVIQKGDLAPGQSGDLVPGQALQPGKAQDDALRAGLLPLQYLTHGGLLRPVHNILPHGVPPPVRAAAPLSLHDKPSGFLEKSTCGRGPLQHSVGFKRDAAGTAWTPVRSQQPWRVMRPPDRRPSCTVKMAS